MCHVSLSFGCTQDFLLLSLVCGAAAIAGTNTDLCRPGDVELLQKLHNVLHLAFQRPDCMCRSGLILRLTLHDAEHVKDLQMLPSSIAYRNVRSRNVVGLPLSSLYVHSFSVCPGVIARAVDGAEGRPLRACE